ncbi:putative transcriptional regulator [Cylindrospermum stagnale PCC 7417]|uniref:Putative transcriptional regulator n=1 Tax=Cylindrospermum stagnale PCC 7417 TaxID=56107 RepID=K9X472_9NOST|nr:helix-turn-helix transcriptional regulator [Cylindrospermum stagnale]AFZ27258.1 putative transcriptional regulator [Cylindrospermum stagnale PCC 7417]
MTNQILVVKQPKIGRMIREMRLLTGLTQEQFAAHIGVTYPTINRWENGHFQPSPLAMEKIEKKLRDLGEQGENLQQKYLN